MTENNSVILKEQGALKTLHFTQWCNSPCFLPFSAKGNFLQWIGFSASSTLEKIAKRFAKK
jgi:hypothetical protein